MPSPRRKAQNVARVCHELLVAHDESNTASLYQCNLLVWMVVSRRYQAGRKMQPANHQTLANDHLSLYPLVKVLDWHSGPIRVLRL